MSPKCMNHFDNFMLPTKRGIITLHLERLHVLIIRERLPITDCLQTAAPGLLDMLSWKFILCHCAPVYL